MLHDGNGQKGELSAERVSSALSNTLEYKNLHSARKILEFANEKLHPILLKKSH